MSMTQHWLQSLSLRELLDEELWWRQHPLGEHQNQDGGWLDTSVIDSRIAMIHAELRRRGVIR